MDPQTTNLAPRLEVMGLDKMSDWETIGAKVEGEKILQEKCRTYLDLWAHHKEHIEEADEITKVTEPGKRVNFSLAYSNAKLNVSLTSERYRTYQTECKLDDAAVKIQNLEWKLSDLKNLVLKEKEKAHAAEARAKTDIEAQRQLEAAHAFHKQELEAIKKDLEQKVTVSDARCQQLRHEVDEKNKQLANTQQELRKVQKTLQEVAQARDDSIVQVTLLTLELGETKRETAHLTDSLAALDPNNPTSTSHQLQEVIQEKAVEIERLSTVISSKDVVIEALRSEKEALYNQLDVTTKDVLEMKEAMEDIQRQAIAAEKGHEKAMKVMEKQSTATNKLVAKKEEALQKLKLQLEKLQEENQQKKKENADNRKQLKELEQKCTEASKNVSEKEKSLEKVMEEIDELRLENAGLTALCENREKEVKDGKSNETKVKELELQLEMIVKSVANKDEQLKEITQRLEDAHKENDSLLSKYSALEGNLERKSSKALIDYKERLKAMEEQYDVANTLVGKLDRKIEKLTQKLAQSEQSCAAVEAGWVHRHSKAVEMLENQLKETERRCTEATTLGDEKENTFRMIKQQLEDTQKENSNLRTQLSELERQEESEICLGDRGAKTQNALGAAAGGEASTRKPLTKLSDIRSSKRGARGGKNFEAPVKVASRKRGVEQAIDTASDEEETAPTPTPRKGSSRKRQLKKTPEAIGPTPQAKRRPPRNGGAGTTSKRLANPSNLGGNALAQLLVGCTPLPPKPTGSYAPTTGSKRKLGSFSGSIMR